jgi:hypothetical protein
MVCRINEIEQGIKSFFEALQDILVRQVTRM